MAGTSDEPVAVPPPRQRPVVRSAARPVVRSAARPVVRAGPRSRTRQRYAPVLVAAAATTGWAALLSYLPVLVLVWLGGQLGGGTGVPAAVAARFATAGWLLAHGVPLHLSGGRFSLAPLAVTLFAAWRVGRAGVHTARAIGAGRGRPARFAVTATAAVALMYGLLGAAAAAAVTGTGAGVAGLASAGPGGPLGVAPAALRGGVTFALFAVLAAGAGAALASGTADRLVSWLPQVLRDALRTGVVAALLTLGAGAGVAGIAVAVAAGDASDMVASYHAGVAGQAGLILLCVLYAPNVAGWSAAYLVGPGFAVGAGTTVSVATVSLGPLPAIPVLVGLPASAVSGPGGLLLGLPVAAAMAAGVLLVRRRLRRHGKGTGPALRWPAMFAITGLAGPVAGVVLGLYGWACGGALGDGRLALTGPPGGWLAVVGTGVVAVGASLGAVAAYVLIGPRPPRG